MFKIFICFDSPEVSACRVKCDKACCINCKEFLCADREEDRPNMLLKVSCHAREGYRFDMKTGWNSCVYYKKAYKHAAMKPA